MCERITKSIWSCEWAFSLCLFLSLFFSDYDYDRVCKLVSWLCKKHLYQGMFLRDRVHCLAFQRNYFVWIAAYLSIYIWIFCKIACSDFNWFVFLFDFGFCYFIFRKRKRRFAFKLFPWNKVISDWIQQIDATWRQSKRIIWDGYDTFK